MLFTQNLTYDLLGVLVSLTICLIAYMKWSYAYWTRKGLYQTKDTIPFGSATDLFLMKTSLPEMFRDIYSEIKAKGLKHGGTYFLMKKFYVPVDLDILKHVMLTDFQHFLNHGNHCNENVDPLSGNLFFLQDEKWKTLRVKLTPTFTSGKMKMMFHTMADCTIGLKEILEDHLSIKKPLDIKDIMGRFTTDIIGCCGFGLEINSMKDPNSLFRKYGNKTFERTNIQVFQDFMQFALPTKVLDLIKLRAFPKDVFDFFSTTVKKTVEHRERNNVYRKDFMHLLLQLKNIGKVSDDKSLMVNGESKQIGLNMDELTAQAFSFFVAGFETSSTTMTWVLYNIATRPDIQKKMQEEIDRVLAKYDNKLTYDGIMEMTYLAKVINETLRMYPPVPFLTRVCTKNYTVPGTDIEIERGTLVAISTLAIHHDPDIYPNPEEFNPENFNEENQAARHHFSWIPFGEGPRLCIGMRFGVLQSKIGLTTLLRDFNISLNKKTKTPVKFSKNDAVLAAEGRIWLDIRKREKIVL